MRSESLPELIDRFVSYKRANGYQYQTGAYYLKKYASFVMETASETTSPDKASVEGFLEKLQDTPGSLYNAAAFLREFSRYLAARGIRAYIIPSGSCIFPHRSSRIFLRNRRSLRSSGNATGPWRILI